MHSRYVAYYKLRKEHLLMLGLAYYSVYILFSMKTHELSLLNSALKTTSSKQVSFTIFYPVLNWFLIPNFILLVSFSNAYISQKRILLIGVAALFIVSDLLCQSLLCFLALSSVCNEVPLFNRKAVFPVRINATAGRCMHTIYIYRDILYHLGSKRQRVGSSAKVFQAG